MQLFRLTPTERQLLTAVQGAVQAINNGDPLKDVLSDSQIQDALVLLDQIARHPLPSEPLRSTVAMVEPAVPWPLPTTNP